MRAVATDSAGNQHYARNGFEIAVAIDGMIPSEPGLVDTLSLPGSVADLQVLGARRVLIAANASIFVAGFDRVLRTRSRLALSGGL